MRKKHIAIFASGSGTNAEKIMAYYNDHEYIDVTIVLSNKPNAGVLKRAEKFDVFTRVFDREVFYNTREIPDLLRHYDISLIVLAGFLWLVPVDLIHAFPGRIINIHPALLPKYGGKGMYGLHVHRAVIDNGEIESGITIHFVNEVYDEGMTIKQVKCEVRPDDTPESLASRIHVLEHRHYPVVIEKVLSELD